MAEPTPTPQEPSTDRVRDAASETVREGADVRARVRELTLLALQRQRFDRHGVREVVKAASAYSKQWQSCRV